MKTKAIIIITSYLSDCQHTTSKKMIDHNINFAKFLLLKYNDTSVEIDPDMEYELFKQKHPNL